MRSRDERRLPDDEKYVLFFFFSSSFPLHSMEKYCLSFLSRVFVHHYQFLSLRPLLLLLRFFFGSFSPYFLFSVYLTATTTKTDIVSNGEREKPGIKGKKENMSRTLTWQHLFAIHLTMAQSY